MATTAPGMGRPIENTPTSTSHGGGEWDVDKTNFQAHGYEDAHGYEEEDTSLGQLGGDPSSEFGGMGSMGYEEEEQAGGSMMNYGFEAPPVADPFAPGVEDGFDLSCGQENPYPEREDAPPPLPTHTMDAAVDLETSIADDVCNTSDYTTNDHDVNDSLSGLGDDGSTPPPPVPSPDVDDDAEGPPPTPDVDYDAEQLKVELTPEQVRDREAESAAAAEALKEMGLEIKKPRRKAKKDRKSRKSRVGPSREASSNASGISDDVGVETGRRKSPDMVDAAAVAALAQPLGPLPADSAASLVNENEMTLGSHSIEADTQSPNDVLLTFRQRLVEIEDAVGGSPKLRYTSVASSEGYLAFGIATGGTFIFARGDHSFQCALAGAQMDRSVSRLAFAPDDHILAVGVESGAIHLWRGPWAHPTKKPALLKTVVEHSGATIISMSWSVNSKNLFVGDSNGLVTRSPVLKAAMIPATSKMFPKFRALQKIVSNVVPQTDVVHRCGCSVVQVEAGRAGVVLISTLKQTFIADPSKRALWVVGKKLRYGEFGACFGPGRSYPAVFSARPGSRIWIAKSRTGGVTATISVKDHFDCSSTPILNPKGVEAATSSPSQGAQSTNFAQLISVREKYLLSWSRDRIIIIDPGKARLVGWYTDLCGIIDVSVINDEIFVLHDGTEGTDDAPPTPPRCIHLALLSPGETAAAMTVAGNVQDGAAMVAEYYQNATPEKFLENVQEADLTLVQQQLSEEKNASPELVEKLFQLAARSADLRAEEASRVAADAEQQFMRNLNSRETQSLVVDATIDGSSSDEHEFAIAVSRSGVSPQPTTSTGTHTIGDTEDDALDGATVEEVSEYGELDGPIVT